jgi:fructokinase
VVVGESLVDVVHRPGVAGDVEHPGGSAANVAVALSRLGRPVRFATAWADDARGRVLSEHLAADGVQLLGEPRVLGRTSTALARIGADGAASYTFDLAWRLGPLPPVAPRVVHACSIGAVLEPGAGQVRDLLASLRSSATVTYDVNLRPAVTGTGSAVVAAVEAVAALADVVKASDEDVAGLWPTESEEQVARRLRGLGPVAVVLTRGAAGASVLTDLGRADVATPPTQVSDTIGAGDTFQAALVDALWERDLLGAHRRAALAALSPAGWVPLLEHAARAAAINVSRPGADPPYRHELAG